MPPIEDEPNPWEAPPLWKGVLFSLTVFSAFTILPFLHSIRQPPQNPVPAVSADRAEERLTPARSFRKPHSPRNQRFNCLLETA